MSSSNREPFLAPGFLSWIQGNIFCIIVLFNYQESDNIMRSMSQPRKYLWNGTHNFPTNYY